MSKFIPGTFLSNKLKPSDLLSEDFEQIAPILIVGMHNSGTSILAEVLDASGVFLGANMAHNESHFFSIFLNNTVLLGGGSAWADLPLKPVEEIMTEGVDLKEFIIKSWRTEYLQCGYDGHSKWGVKDPRICVLLPLYLHIFPNAKIVHITRNINDTAASLCNRKKAGVGRVDDFDFWKKLTCAYRDRVKNSIVNQSNYHEISYEKLCKSPLLELTDLFSFLNLNITSKTIEVVKTIDDSKIGSFERMKEKAAKRI